MKLWLILISLIALLLTSCSQKVYVKQNCPYVEPIDLNLTTNVLGGFDAVNAFKAVEALRYYKTETKRLKKFVNDNKQKDT